MDSFPSKMPFRDFHAREEYETSEAGRFGAFLVRRFTTPACPKLRRTSQFRLAGWSLRSPEHNDSIAANGPAEAEARHAEWQAQEQNHRAFVAFEVDPVFATQ